MTDSPTPSEPRIRTEAGRQLERDMGGDLFDAILAIEAEAATNGARQTLASIARAAEPAALDVERVKRAIFIVADNEEYDLQYTKEVHRLANDVAARLQSLTDR